MSQGRPETQEERISREVREVEARNRQLEGELVRTVGEWKAEGTSLHRKIRQLELENGMLRQVVLGAFGQTAGGYINLGIGAQVRERVSRGERGGGSRTSSDEYEEPAFGSRTIRHPLVDGGPGPRRVGGPIDPEAPSVPFEEAHDLRRRPIKDNPQA